MGGERLIVYLRPRHFPTDFCHVSNGPGRGKLSCNLAGKYCSGQSVLTLSCCGSCLLLHRGARAVPGQTPLSQEGKKTTARDSSIPDSQATTRAGYLCSRTEVTLKGKGFPSSRAWLSQADTGASGEGSGSWFLFGWEKKTEQMKTLSPGFAWHHSATAG